MTLLELVKKIEPGYEPATEIPLSEYYEEDGYPVRPPPIGDKLAAFVANELYETFDPGADDMAQMTMAAKAIQTAVEELQGIVAELVSLGVRDPSDPDCSRDEE